VDRFSRCCEQFRPSNFFYFLLLKIYKNTTKHTTFKPMNYIACGIFARSITWLQRYVIRHIQDPLSYNRHYVMFTWSQRCTMFVRSSSLISVPIDNSASSFTCASFSSGNISDRSLATAFVLNPTKTYLTIMQWQERGKLTYTSYSIYTSNIL